MANFVDGQLVEYIVDEIANCVGNYRNILAVIGAFYIIRKALGLLFNTLKGFQIYFVSRLFTERNLGKICGGKWAVITGASDGIGKAFAYELAKYNFNIVLLSRSLSKLAKVAKELETKYGVETKIISADFSCDANGKIYEDIKKQINELDIGILVNNVGTHYGIPAYFLDVPQQKLRDLVNINMSSMTMMTHMVLPGMVDRKRGAIINLSSSAAQHPSPLITVYSATKAYVDFFSHGLAIEYSKDNIVVQCLKPYYISTAMTFHTSPNLFVPSAATYVRSALATLPYARRTCGFWSHGLQAWVLSFVPEWLWLHGCYYWHIILRNWLRKTHPE